MPGAGAGYDSTSRRKALSFIVIHIPGYLRLLTASYRRRLLTWPFLSPFRGFP
ncbi:hypothetical protein OHAE_3076 [Ochrobactrum soli]|uniref:Uncharacterized protein n=1 Tax=Ochrobactrum soli TaxID=2448455 RepID=A0A2P9HGB6_9HYPH|nr:hypothetical protein OHAE_3076 [[Ochrobactrum] soli]